MNTNLIVFSGNPKAASTWLGGLLTGISIEMGKLIFYGQYAIPENFKKIRDSHYDVLISQSSNYDMLQSLQKNYKCIHVIRDPRDVTVSSYYSYKTTHDTAGWPALAKLRDKLLKCDFEEGLIEIMDFNKYFFEQLGTWNYNDKNVFEFKYEDIILTPEVSILEMCQFLGLTQHKNSSFFFTIGAIYNRVLYRFPFLYPKLRIPQREIPQDNIKRINKKLSFKKLSKGRKHGQENDASHYRKGVGGDWKNHFNDKLKVEFKKKYGDLLVKLGYEKNNDW